MRRESSSVAEQSWLRLRTAAVRFGPPRVGATGTRGSAVRFGSGVGSPRIALRRNGIRIRCGGDLLGFGLGGRQRLRAHVGDDGSSDVGGWCKPKHLLAGDENHSRMLLLGDS